MPTRMARVLVVLSPAKTMEMSRVSGVESSSPVFLQQTKAIVQELCKLSVAQMKSLFKVSDAIAQTTHQRYQAFEMTAQDQEPSTSSAIRKQAALAFNGPAFQGLGASEWQPDDFTYAQDHLRILCALYGILRPLDLIQAYRLEMAQALSVADTKNLYEFWSDPITSSINDYFAVHEQPEDEQEDAAPTKTRTNLLVNVASKEYFKCIDVNQLDPSIHVVECSFLDDGRVKSVFAKKARGLFCRFVVESRADSFAKLQQFNAEGYAFNEAASSDSLLVFERSSCRAKASSSSANKRRKLK